MIKKHAKDYKLEDVASFEKLMQAHYRARKCKRHKKDVILFEVNMFYYLTMLEKALLDGTYSIKRYKKFYVYEPKEREIQALEYYDRVVQNSICHNFLTPYFSRRLIYDNAACQKNKGTHFCRNRLEGFLHGFFKTHGINGYFLKMDIKKYFNNIDHEILKQKLGYIADPRLRKLIYHIVDSYSHNVPGKGVPMGNQSSQTFALYYLDSVDRLIKEKYRIKYYVRYMDDLIVIHHSKEYLQKLYDEVKQEIAKLKLELNKKSEIIPIKNGVEFLGVRYRLLKSGKLLKRMKHQSKMRMVGKIKALKHRYKLHLCPKEEVEMSLAGFHGNIKRLTVDGLRVKYLCPLKKLISKKDAQ
ncbi:MAG: RNA-directed DNA polymerase [Clostridia bacterium]|nr:RNA-directed DNA polymerase [Clostridia bacterium]